MAEFAAMGYLELWYRMSDLERGAELVEADNEAQFRRLARVEECARRRTSLHALGKLTEFRQGRFHWRADHPVLVPVEELLPEHDPAEVLEAVRMTMDAYAQTLRSDRRQLLDRYELVDVALKVVGVGSVGTRCYVLLLQGRDQDDPLLLQAKEAGPSALEEFLGPSKYRNHGHRVVAGQRMVQAQSDIFLGWATGPSGRDYYVRQLRDWKASFEVEKASRSALNDYARVCGHIMARGHARTEDPAAIAGYLGTSHKFDRAVAAFAERYAVTSLEDCQAFVEAIAAGDLPTSPEPYA